MKDRNFELAEEKSESKWVEGIAGFILGIGLILILLSQFPNLFYDEDKLYLFESNDKKYYNKPVGNKLTIFDSNGRISSTDMPNYNEFLCFKSNLKGGIINKDEIMYIQNGELKLIDKPNYNELVCINDKMGLNRFDKNEIIILFDNQWWSFKDNQFYYSHNNKVFHQDKPKTNELLCVNYDLNWDIYDLDELDNSEDNEIKCTNSNQEGYVFADDQVVVMVGNDFYTIGNKRTIRLLLNLIGVPI